MGFEWDDAPGPDPTEFEPGVPLVREPPLGPTWAGAVAAVFAVTVVGHLALGIDIVLIAKAFAAVGVQSIVAGGLWGRSGPGAFASTGVMWGSLLWLAHRSPVLGLVVFAIGVGSVVVLTVLILRRMPLDPPTERNREGTPR